MKFGLAFSRPTAAKGMHKALTERREHVNTCENDRFIAAAKAIEKGAYYTDPWDQNAYCRYCNCCQCHEEPTHDEECPVMVVAVTAHRMQHGLAAEAAA